MSKSIKFKNNTYLDSNGVVFEKEPLSRIFTFSTKEQIVGKWINGKTLYRKVISTNEPVIGGTNLPIKHNVSNWDRMWVDLANSYYYEENRKRSLPLEQTYYTTTDSVDKAHIYIEGDYVYLVSYGGWGEHWEKVITLLYTKTTE